MVLENQFRMPTKRWLRYLATPARSVTSTTKRLPVRYRKSERYRCFHAIPSGNKGEYGKQASEVFAVLINKDKAAGISLFDANSQFKKAKFAYYAAYHDKKNAGLTVKIRLLLSKPVWMPQVWVRRILKRHWKNQRFKKHWKNGKPLMMSPKSRSSSLCR